MGDDCEPIPLAADIGGTFTDLGAVDRRDGSLILAGPTLGQINTGIHIFEAPDEETAERMMNEDPAIASGIGKGELRRFRAAFLRGQPTPG